MDRIVFENGKGVSSAYLNEIQKGDKFTAAARDDFYSEPTTSDQSGWDINERDRVKDWEIADPRSEVQTGIGRLAHDGIVLGWDSVNSVVLAPGTPSTRPFNGGVGVTVEAGSIIARSGTPISWSRQTLQILGGSGSTSYIYLSEAEALADIANSEPVSLTIANSLPSVTSAHVPLAKLVLNTSADGLATNPTTGEVVGTGYVDLRPNVFVGNLNTYPKNLVNTPIKNTNYTAKVWDRVIADTSGGSIVVTLPESPADSDRLAVVDISGTFNSYPLILRVNPVSEEQLNDSLDDWIVNIRDAHIEFFYHAATGQWKFEEAPGSECNPVLGTFLSCGGREFIGEKTATECPDGTPLPFKYPETSPGVYDFEPSGSNPSVGKCYRNYSEKVALYATGDGGLIHVSGAARCDRDYNTTTVFSTRNVVYVDCTIGDDSIDNNGYDDKRPFRTIERAAVEGMRESFRTGVNNDRYDKMMIEVAPGDYYVDNSPGNSSTLSPTDSTGLFQRLNTSYSVISVTSGSRYTHITINSNNATSTQPPHPLNLGRVLYSESGGVGNICRLEKVSVSSPNWIVTLEYVKGSFLANDQLYYDRLSAINPTTGGVIIGRGMSVDGVDPRKVRIRPMYVPELSEGQSTPQSDRTAIFKVTGGTYISQVTFTDNQQYHRSHNTVTSITFASQGEIAGGGSETSYYAKLTSLLKDVDNWGSEGLEAIPAETTIVAPVAQSKDNRGQDIEENLTGLLVAGGDSRPNAPIAYPGATRIRDTDGTILPLPDVNSTRSSSPYVLNCAVRSIFGLNGLWAEGSKVEGFKSMVTANFTQVSIQTDPNCFETGTYSQDPPVNKTSGSGKLYKACVNDLFKYRHFGIRGSNDSTIQIVSVFCIGNSDHFVSENGADLSITNSCSDFGDISLRSIGYKTKSFSQDEKSTSSGYDGTRITQIIPPLPLSYNALSNGHPATLEDTPINTSLSLDYSKTLAYTVVNKTGSNTPPETIRIYVRNSNVNSQFSLTNPPSAENIAFGQFTYTRKVNSTTWELSGGPDKIERKRIYINGFDEVGNSILYTGNLKAPDPTSVGFSNLDDSSKIFVWDPEPQEYNSNGDLVTGSGCWYIPVTTAGIIEEATDLDEDGYLLKRFDYAFRYKLIPNPTGSNAVYAALDLMFDQSAIKIIRASDLRKVEERVYRVVFEGFNTSRGLRKPQSFYILEKQEGVAGYPLNPSGSDPLTVTSVRTYQEVFKTAKDGAYVTFLTLGSGARSVFNGEIAPAQDRDYPEATEDPTNSPTKVALEVFKARPGVWLSSSLAPSVSPINLKTASSVQTAGIRIGLRRPSVIRASGHTWEWAGYLNYDTALPRYQGEPLESDFALSKILVEESGGRIYATGMNEEGNYYLGTTVFDLRSGEQYSIPLTAEGEQGGVTNQVLNNVVIRNTLLMEDGSNLVLGRGTTIFFSNDTELKSLTTGDIVAGKNPPAVYATKARAGLVQLADLSMIRGAKGNSASGVADKAVVTALDLALELDARFDSSVSGGNGVAVTTSQVELPGGDPNDPTDNVTQFEISVGLPLNNDTVALAGLKLGSLTGQEVTQIVNSASGINTLAPEDTKLVTEKALANRFVNNDRAQTIAGEKTFNNDITINAELKVTGDITAFFTSDRRLKDNITLLKNPLDRLTKLSGNTFTWNSNSGKSGNDVGVIAQEVSEVQPEAVTVRENGYLAVSYEKLIPLLIESIKELKREIDDLKS